MRFFLPASMSKMRAMRSVTSLPATLIFMPGFRFPR